MTVGLEQLVRDLLPGKRAVCDYCDGLAHEINDLAELDTENPVIVRAIETFRGQRRACARRHHGRVRSN